MSHGPLVHVGDYILCAFITRRHGTRQQLHISMTLLLIASFFTGLFFCWELYFMCIYFQGVLAASPLAFIIPPLCVMKLRQEPVFSKNNIIPILIATFGILVTVIGFIMAIYNFSEGTQCSHGVDMPYCSTVDESLPTNVSAVFKNNTGTTI